VLDTSALKDTAIELSRVTAPLAPAVVREIERLLLGIFEYGDYSFRSALSGEYCATLNCTFFLARHKSQLVGAAGCLYAPKKPAICVIGPVGVAPEYRRKGIGASLVASLLKHLKDQSCVAAYLGVGQGSSARRLYESLGFWRLKGIVMRHLLRPRPQFEENYFSRCDDTNIRPVEWGDLPGVALLACLPCTMYTFDLHRGVFSSKYVEPGKFLSIFPKMMKAHERHGGLANVLAARPEGNVAGLAQLCRGPGEAERHTGRLDFYVHDNFLDRAEPLVRKTIGQSGALSVRRLYCQCLECDHIKRGIIEALGGSQIGVLPDNVALSGRCENVLVYEFAGLSS
jgi:GNAT superfamily N-acetyltransferase